MRKEHAGVGYFLIVFAVVIAIAAAVVPNTPPPAPVSEASLAEARAATGGAQTRESIMARQSGAQVDLSYRAEALGQSGGEPGVPALGTLGGASDSDLFRQLRFGEADVTVTSRGPADDILIQDAGMAWLTFREGPLVRYGLGAMLGMVLVLAAFYLVRGKIRIDGPKTGERITRFAGYERFGHWLLAVSFIILGLTGIITLVGRTVLIPVIGHEANAVIAMVSKWLHNNVAWAFMVGLVMVFVQWVWHNLPDRTDIHWMAKGGGLFSAGHHPPAKKFNAGQKLVFWSVIVLGASISASGLALLFPFELPMFAATFEKLNATGLPALVGLGPLPEVLLPHEEMQLAQAWHGIVAMLFMVIIVAHIYLGSVGMEGAFDAMGSGEVEAQWAKEHHALWYEEVMVEPVVQNRTPAE